jgi:hypothetical protein
VPLDRVVLPESNGEGTRPKRSAQRSRAGDNFCLSGKGSLILTRSRQPTLVVRESSTVTERGKLPPRIFKGLDLFRTWSRLQSLRIEFVTCLFHSLVVIDLKGLPQLTPSSCKQDWDVVTSSRAATVILSLSDFIVYHLFSDLSGGVSVRRGTDGRLSCPHNHDFCGV